MKVSDNPIEFMDQMCDPRGPLGLTMFEDEAAAEAELYKPTVLTPYKHDRCGKWHLLLGFAVLVLCGSLYAQSGGLINGTRGFPQANDGTTGTTLNGTATINAAGNAINATTANTGVPLFIVVGGAGTSGNATLASAGTLAPCTMDSTIASNAGGFFVVQSVINNNQCHAQSAAPPAGTWVIGTLAVSVTVANSTALVEVAGFYFGAASGGSAWSALTNPSGNLSLTMGTNTSAWSIGDFGASPVNGVFSITDTAATGTDKSTNFLVNTGGSSSHNPVAFQIQGVNQFQVCWQSGPQGESVIGSSVACSSINQSPFAKLVVMSSTAAHTITRLYQNSTAATGIMQEFNNATASGSGYFFTKYCAGATGSDTGCGSGTIVASLRGDGLFTTTNLTISGLSGTQCLHEISGVVSGTGVDCGSGGGTINNAAQFSAPYYSGAGSNNILSGFAGITGQIYTFNNAAAPTANSPGIQDGNAGAAVTTTPYSVQCDSATAIVDRATVIRLQSGASVVNIPAHTTTGCGANFVFALVDDGAGTVTINAGGSDTFSVFDGATNTDGATSFTLSNGRYALLNNGASTVWEVRKSPIGVSSSVSDNGTTFTYSGTGGIALTGTGAQYSVTQGTTTVAYFSDTSTWNASGTAIGGFFSNITCTAAAAGSTLFQLEVGGANYINAVFKNATCGNFELDLGNSGGSPSIAMASLSGNSPEIKLGSGGAYAFTSGSAGSSVDTVAQRVAAGVVGLAASQAGANTALLLSGNACKVTSAITLSTSATTVCSWSLPASAQTWAWECDVPYAITAGTSPTFTLGMNPSQTPTNVTGYASIFSTNAGVSTQGTASATTSGNTNILTGATVSNGTFLSHTSGTIQASATAGTFAITATLGGTTPAGTIPVGARCTLN